MEWKNPQAGYKPLPGHRPTSFLNQPTVLLLDSGSPKHWSNPNQKIVHPVKLNMLSISSDPSNYLFLPGTGNYCQSAKHCQTLRLSFGAHVESRCWGCFLADCTEMSAIRVRVLWLTRLWQTTKKASPGLSVHTPSQTLSYRLDSYRDKLCMR